MPAGVIRAARKHLLQLEQESVSRGLQPDLFSAQSVEAETTAERLLLAELRELDPDTLSAREALELIYKLKRELDR